MPPGDGREPRFSPEGATVEGGSWSELQEVGAGAGRNPNFAISSKAKMEGIGTLRHAFEIILGAFVVSPQVKPLARRRPSRRSVKIASQSSNPVQRASTHVAKSRSRPPHAAATQATPRSHAPRSQAAPRHEAGPMPMHRPRPSSDHGASPQRPAVHIKEGTATPGPKRPVWKPIALCVPALYAASEDTGWPFSRSDPLNP